MLAEKTWKRRVKKLERNMVSGIGVTLLLLLVLPFSSVVSPKAAAVTEATKTAGSSSKMLGPTSITETVFTEDFESVFPGTSWTVGDRNANNGLDYWGATGYRSRTGSSSGWGAQVGTQPSYQTIFQENFEVSFPGTSWTVGDWNHDSGDDYWGATTYRSNGGSNSVWCAQVGVQTRTDVIFYDGFENNLGSSWTETDTDPTSGQDYWGCTTYRVNSGSCSAWCAEMGREGLYGEYNSVTHRYDDGMDAILELSVPPMPSGYRSATLHFHYWVNSEYGCDFLSVKWFDPLFGWQYCIGQEGSTGGWTEFTGPISYQSTELIQFIFRSDDSNHDYEGAYIDDVEIIATGDFFPNRWCHNYDNNMEALMYSEVDLSQYSSVRLNYFFWLDTSGAGNYLTVIYRIGGTWNVIDFHSGIHRYWDSGTVILPNSITAVGFKFCSSGQPSGEGAYLDDILLEGIPNNGVVHRYDDNMDAYMYRPVDLSRYDESVSLSYWYWLNCEVQYDWLQLMWSYDGSTWYYHGLTGNSNGWQHETWQISQAVKYVGFRFFSDGSIHDFEGAYIDDIVCTGTMYYHDVAVLDVKPFKTVVCMGYSVSVDVTCKNLGEVQESFDVQLGSLTFPAIIGTKSVVLPSGASTTLTFQWDTTGFPKAQYVLAAYASYGPLEADTTNNQAFYGTVTVSMLGDITGPNGVPDGKVDIMDVSKIAILYGVSYPDPRYVANYDINGDSKIDIKDVAIVSKNFGKIDP